MKAINVFASALLISLQVTCSKSDTDNSVAPASTGVLTAQIDGQL